MRPDQSPVSLQLFFRPGSVSREELRGERLLAAVRGLYENVYHIEPDDPLFQATFGGPVNPRLVPAVDALGGETAT
jgi:hypothetical protein